MLFDNGIDRQWLRAIEGAALFYPAAGDDTVPFVEAFSPYIRQFHFNDLFYSTSRDRRPAAPSIFRTIAAEHPDPFSRNLRIPARALRGRWRNIDPTTLVERLTDGETEIVIHRRRGFGQYALSEFKPHSIGVFVHRLDSPGEGGSNMWFLANRQKDHEPLSNLWDKLALRLADTSIVVSDGCLTDFEFLEETRRIERIGSFDPSKFGVRSFKGFAWHCIGQMPDRHGTLVWGLKREYINPPSSSLPANP